MKIECILKRAGGTEVLIEETTYHFEPDTNDAHVAEVKNEAHAKIFLGIPEAYQAAGGKKQEKQEKNKEVALKGIDWSPALVNYGDGKSITTAELVQLAFEASGITKEEWNLAEDDAIQTALEAQLVILQPEESAAPDTKDVATDGQLAAASLQPTAPAAKQSKAEKKAALAARKAELGQR